MTDNTMREAFEKWAKAECFDLTAVGGFYSDNETDAAYKAWQAAQSVPVVGEPVAWGVTKRYEDNVWFISDSRFTAQHYANQYTHRIGAEPDQVVVPLYAKPTHSITAQELDALRKDAESYRRLVAAAKAEADTHCTYPDCICPDGVSSGSCNLGLPDATIAGDKK